MDSNKIKDYLKYALNFILYAGKSREDYEISSDDMTRNNVALLRVLSAMATVIFLICYIMAKDIQVMSNHETVYWGGVVFSFIIFVLSLPNEFGKTYVNVLIYVFDILILISGILFTLVCDPKSMTVTLIPLVLLVPVIFDTKPYRINILVLLADAGYLFFAGNIKPRDILYQDILHLAVFSSVGIFLGSYVMKTKIERYVYAAEIKRKAVTDDLTGCYNRRALQDARAVGLDMKNLCIIMIDVNRLKKINDTLGHNAGDELIKGVAAELKNSFENPAKSFRLGGDEFLVYMNTTKEDLEKRILQFHENLANFKGQFVSGISVSLGYATSVDYPGMSVSGLMEKADQGMYMAKTEFHRKNG